MSIISLSIKWHQHVFMYFWSSRCVICSRTTNFKQSLSICSIFYVQVKSTLGGSEQAEKEWTANESPVPLVSFSLSFSPFTQAEFMRPLQVRVQCQQCPTNIFIQRCEEQRGGPVRRHTHCPGDKLSSQLAVQLNTHTHTHLRHLTGLSISNTLAGFFQMVNSAHDYHEETSFREESTTLKPSQMPGGRGLWPTSQTFQHITA